MKIIRWGRHPFEILGIHLTGDMSYDIDFKEYHFWITILNFDIGFKVFIPSKIKIPTLEDEQ